LVEEVGGIPVKGDTSTFANKFKRGKVDVIFSPAAVYEPLELYRGLEPNGGIVSEPLLQLTLQMVIRKDSFPDGFGQAAREIALDEFDRTTEIALKAEDKIEKSFWIKANPYEIERLTEIIRQARVRLRDEGVYDGRMLKILRKLRCRNTPNAKECFNPIE